MLYLGPVRTYRCTVSSCTIEGGESTATTTPSTTALDTQYRTRICLIMTIWDVYTFWAIPHLKRYRHNVGRACCNHCSTAVAVPGDSDAALERPFSRWFSVAFGRWSKEQPQHLVEEGTALLQHKQQPTYPSQPVTKRSSPDSNACCAISHTRIFCARCEETGALLVVLMVAPESQGGCLVHQTRAGECHTTVVFVFNFYPTSPFRDES